MFQIVVLLLVFWQHCVKSLVAFVLAIQIFLIYLGGLLPSHVEIRILCPNKTCSQLSTNSHGSGKRLPIAHIYSDKYYWGTVMFISHFCIVISLLEVARFALFGCQMYRIWCFYKLYSYILVWWLLLKISLSLWNQVGMKCTLQVILVPVWSEIF